MVSMHKTTTEKATSWMLGYLPIIILGLLVMALLPHLSPEDHSRLDYGNSALRHIDVPELSSKNSLKNYQKNGAINRSSKDGGQCPYQSIQDLTEEEQHPVKGPRHIVTPPEDGSLHLVCCQTTKGLFNALVHEKWAPNGAKRFLDMVQSGYFSSTVPLMRCLKGFLCQFGLNKDPQQTKLWRRKNLPDDPNWPPEGKEHRTNEDGVIRFARGYLAYAGGGKDSRTNQFIVSLKIVKTLAGGSPWEVPWGELVGPHSFETLSKFYFGYGEKGPPQGKLGNQGMTPEMKKEFPDLDYITGCQVVDQRIEE